MSATVYANEDGDVKVAEDVKSAEGSNSEQNEPVGRTCYQYKAFSDLEQCQSRYAAKDEMNMPNPSC